MAVALRLALGYRILLADIDGALHVKPSPGVDAILADP